jgi:hypothetical protein
MFLNFETTAYFYLYNHQPKLWCQIFFCYYARKFYLAGGRNDISHISLLTNFLNLKLLFQDKFEIVGQVKSLKASACS